MTSAMRQSLEEDMGRSPMMGWSLSGGRLNHRDAETQRFPAAGTSCNRAHAPVASQGCRIRKRVRRAGSTAACDVLADESTSRACRRFSYHF
ncbi:protein of unknown function [Azospirillum baldaniorum]|uniref:Uncharacterized protein n=1 Tax=Azospirillum baldaniorum TaxID=1064539 RepID=A0A9P1JSP9_9PROT|nr:protein of unknown function [Azospirillum baldaniorum]